MCAMHRADGASRLLAPVPSLRAACCWCSGRDAVGLGEEGDPPKSQVQTSTGPYAAHGGPDAPLCDM